jgi:hypothetical protein
MAVIGATQLQPVNVLEQYARGLELGAAQRGLERQEVERIKAADQQAALNEMYRAAMQPSGAVDMNTLYTMMAQRGMGGAIPGVQTQQADVAFKTAQAAKQQQDANTAFWAQSRDQLATIPETDQAAYQAWAINVVQRAPWARQFLPATLNAQSKRQLLMTADAALPKGTTSEVGGMIVTTDPYTGKEIGKVDYSAAEQAARRAGASVQKIENWVPASETAQAEFIKEFRDTYKQLKTSPTDIANLRRAGELAKTEARKYMGTGGQAFLSAAKFLKNRLGVDVDAQAIAGAEEARTVLFQNVLNNLRKLDAQPSQEQQRIMQEALGNLDTDPDALPRVVELQWTRQQQHKQNSNVEIRQRDNSCQLITQSCLKKSLKQSLGMTMRHCRMQRCKPLPRARQRLRQHRQKFQYAEDRRFQTLADVKPDFALK